MNPQLLPRWREMFISALRDSSVDNNARKRGAWATNYDTKLKTLSGHFCGFWEYRHGRIEKYEKFGVRGPAVMELWYKMGL